MGIISGYVCLVLLILLLLKFVARKLRWKKLNNALMVAHKYIAFSFLLVAILHLILSIRVIEGRAMIVTVSGIIVLGIGLLLTILCHIMKRRDLEKRCHQFLSLLMAIFLIAHVIFYFIDFQNYKVRINDIQISEIDLSDIDDGSYTGEYDAGYICAKVRVTVCDHRITDVTILKHINERGKSAEVITERMVEENRIDVDAISSATNSSKVIKQACINAFKEN